MLLLKFRALKALGQLLADGLLNDAGAGKANQRAGLCECDIAKARKAGADSSGRRVRQVRDIQAALLCKTGQRGAGFRHLHQRENSLLHSCAAAGTENDQGKLFFQGVFHGAGDDFADLNTHAAHKKAAVQHCHNGGLVVNLQRSEQSGLRQPCFLPAFFQLFRVPGEIQRVFRAGRQIENPQASRVRQHIQALLRRNRKMMPALGADHLPIGQVCP